MSNLCTIYVQFATEFNISLYILYVKRGECTFQDDTVESGWEGWFPVFVVTKKILLYILDDYD